MRKLIILIFLPYILFGQNNTKEKSDSYLYKARYELTYQPDSTNSDILKSENMLLYISDNISRFSSAGQAIGDSLMSNIDRSNKSRSEFLRIRSQIPDSNFKYYIYKGIPENKVSFTRKILKDNFKYEENLKNTDWIILDEKKEIQGYRSQKAKTSFAGRDYIAWFTDEIPISEGPYKFNGLPGLIIKINDVRNHYNFRLISFQKLKNPINITYNEDDFITATKKKVEEIKSDYDKDPISFLERAGMTFKFGDGERERNQRQHSETMKKQNNPIELE